MAVAGGTSCDLPHRSAEAIQLYLSHGELMSHSHRSKHFWNTAGFLTVSLPVLLLGQTLGLIDYPQAVQLGLQESVDQVSAYGVQVNRAFAAADTFVYIPLIVASLIGLYQRKPWSMVTLAAVGGISVYWSITVGVMLLMLEGVPGQLLEAGISYLLFIGIYTVFGVWSLYVAVCHPDQLLQ